jgi:hypothetical protein
MRCEWVWVWEYVGETLDLGWLVGSKECRGSGEVFLYFGSRAQPLPLPLIHHMALELDSSSSALSWPSPDSV